LQHNKVLTRHVGEVVSSGAVISGRYLCCLFGRFVVYFSAWRRPTHTHYWWKSLLNNERAQINNTSFKTTIPQHNIYNGTLTAIIWLCYLPDRHPRKLTTNVQTLHTN